MQVGFIGTGLMGLPMAQSVLNAGHSLTVYNRTAAKLDPLKEAGATITPKGELLRIATTPTDVIQSSTCIVLMLTNADAIYETVLSDASRAVLAGKTVIQMGTIAPSDSKAIRDQVANAGGDYLEAPVLGSIPEAREGTLLVMVGSTPEQLEQWSPILKCFGPDPQRIGPVGTAAALKLALNQLIGSLTSAFATSLGFILQEGVEVESFMTILRSSALYAPTFDKKLQRMLDRNYTNPNFPTKHLLKDTDLFLTAASVDLDTTGVAAVSKILERAMQMGLADADYSALFSAVVGDRGQGIGDRG